MTEVLAGTQAVATPKVVSDDATKNGRQSEERFVYAPELNEKVTSLSETDVYIPGTSERWDNVTHLVWSTPDDIEFETVAGHKVEILNAPVVIVKGEMRHIPTQDDFDKIRAMGLPPY